MPQAQAIEFGLDWDTEINSFWSWFMDARDVLEDGVDSSSLVRELVEQQRDAIERAAKREKHPESARLVLRVAVALVGCSTPRIEEDCCGPCARKACSRRSRRRRRRKRRQHLTAWLSRSPSSIVRAMDASSSGAAEDACARVRRLLALRLRFGGVEPARRGGPTLRRKLRARLAARDGRRAGRDAACIGAGDDVPAVRFVCGGGGSGISD